jgi:hypothetical protein
MHLKNKFWYSKFPEHISFIGTRWVKRFCKENGFDLVNEYKFNYLPFEINLFVKNIAKLTFSLIRVNPERFSNITKDHFCFILRLK